MLVVKRFWPCSPRPCPLQNYQKQLGQLADMVKLVRGKLDRLARLTLGALTVIDVHARDVTKRLIQANMTSVNDFEWISQMRCVAVVVHWVATLACPLGAVSITGISAVGGCELCVSSRVLYPPLQLFAALPKVVAH